MATSVNWISGVISIPRADMPVIQVTPEIRELDIDALRLELRDLEDDPDGRPWTKTHKHNTAVTLSGTTYARSVIFIAPYTITFEDGQYTVKTKGANHNLLDVKNANQVSVITENSAGLIDASATNETIDAIDSKTDLIAFLGGVAIDKANGVSGTGLDANGNQIGTRLAPSDNLVDTKAIADNFGLNQIYIIANILSVTGDFSAGYSFLGDTVNIRFVADDTANLQNCSFETLSLIGQLDGLNTVKDSLLSNNNNISGTIFNSDLKGTLVLNQKLLVINSGSNESVILTTIIYTLTLTNFHGSVTIDQMQFGTNKVEIYGGSVTINANCTGGTLTITGAPYEIIDNSNGTTIIDLTGDTKTRSTNTIAQNDTKRIEEMHGQIPRFVWIDTEAVVNGGGFQQDPFNNWTDAVDYAEAEGLTHLMVLADATIDRQLKNFIITGVGTPIIDTNGQNLDRSEILRCSLTGAYTGRIVAQECNTIGLFTLNGFFEGCAFSADLAVPDGGLALVKDCNSFVIGVTPPQVDIGGVTGTGALVVTGFDGGMRIVNVNQVTDDVKFLTHVGRVIVDPSCTEAQNINVGGVTVLNDFSVGLPPVDVTLSPVHVQDILAALYNRRKHDTTTKEVTLYEPDNITVKQVWDAPDDLSELTPQ